MRKVRVSLAMLLAAGLLLVGGGKAQAVLGIPDDVPASTLLYPFFKVDPTPTADSRQDSLLVITNTANPAAAFGAALPVSLPSTTAHTWVHITIWNVKSQHVYDFSVQLTPHDVFSCSLLDLLVNPNNFLKPCGVFQAPTGVIPALLVGDILAGYVTVDVVTGPTSQFPGEAGYPFQDWNILIGHLYLVDLPQGSATGFNAVSIESTTVNIPTPSAAVGRLGQPAVFFSTIQIQPGFYLNRCIESQGPVAACDPFVAGYDNRERIDGYSGDVVQTTTAIVPSVIAANDSPLSLLVRYFSAVEINASSQIWLWKDRVTSGAQAALTVAVYDEDENAHSITFSLPDEVNFAPTAAIITPGAPGGWLRLKFTCSAFSYCTYDPIVPSTWQDTTGFHTPIQAVAYSLQIANSQSATLRWDAAFPSHRQYTDYIGGPVAE